MKILSNAAYAALLEKIRALEVAVHNLQGRNEREYAYSSQLKDKLSTSLCEVSQLKDKLSKSVCEVTKVRIEQNVFDALAKELPKPCVPKSELEAGVLLGVQMVLERIRQGWVV